MRRICLTLPTNRACAATIAAVHEEAAHAVTHFDVEVHLLVLDSSDEASRAEHARTVRELASPAGVVVHHLDEARQRDFLQRVIERAGLTKPDLVLDLMLPADVSYGACTNRAFLIASALGCDSVHRRDSDSSYQILDGEPVHPLHHELLSLGKRAVDALPGVTRTRLDPADVYKPVAMVGSSFVGELSVDIGEIRDLEPEIYYEVVGLWAEAGTSPEERRELVDDSFVGAGTDPFTHDESTLGTPDIWRIDMCNIGLDHEVYERVPLPPATNTIGSDYFLLHLVRDATLPGVVHNRNIVNYYTPERRTGPGFTAYQLRFTKFLLSMLYLYPVYTAMEEARGALLDEHHHIRVATIADLVAKSAYTDRSENVRRLDVVDRCYRRLGGRYAEFADHLLPMRERLLDEAQADTEDFALLIEAWGPLVAASRSERPVRGVDDA
ncbi:DUF6271 family protein [Streptomyces sp. NBC_00083]|uniref:DUF6271 family protein n=1 Tax=Streptomyces sp. NBC_00083 TaxID=2975647 RepID=UPI002259DA9A|nr:DUF6271 family protein [Streptomyces sp. NBC_00083]MCX5385582.1 DUF6271 family protein [Streptomyces sp. NBC_00083]